MDRMQGGVVMALDGERSQSQGPKSSVSRGSEVSSVRAVWDSWGWWSGGKVGWGWSCGVWAPE